MAGIPPNWLGSIIQGHAGAERAKESKVRENKSDADRIKPDIFAEKLQNAIQATDRDSNVYEDAEGTGGGRASSQGEHDAAEQDDPHAELRELDDDDDPRPTCLDLEA